MSEERKPESGSREGDFDSSVTDARPFRSSNQVAPEPQVLQQLVAPNPGCKLRDEEYNMTHDRRGLALIFNHYRFQDIRLQERTGTQKDCDDLSEVLRNLGFDVEIYHDLTYRDIRNKLEEVRTMNHIDADCLLVAVMTHGKEGLLHANDIPYPVSLLWANFVGEKCLSLVGKPKIFIIQACRGGMLDKGVPVAMERDSHPNSYVLPTHSDVLIVQSAPEGHASWRNEHSGSCFIQALVQELKDLGRTRDLLSILTFVNQRVAIDYQSSNKEVPDFDKKKIIPSFTSMLTRLVYFR
ncbi:caspase-1 [Anabrus simplex]|uniref:caspase-1 n=1 Tax=Anabrus simplex TaxID=316456 RepID=UPI0035A2DF0B